MLSRWHNRCDDVIIQIFIFLIKKEKQQKRNWNEFSISIAFCLSRNQLQGTINCFNIPLSAFLYDFSLFEVGGGAESAVEA